MRPNTTHDIEYRLLRPGPTPLMGAVRQRAIAVRDRWLDELHRIDHLGARGCAVKEPHTRTIPNALRTDIRAGRVRRVSRGLYAAAVPTRQLEASRERAGDGDGDGDS